METIDGCITALNDKKDWKDGDNISAEVEKAFQGIISSSSKTGGVLVCCKYRIEVTRELRTRIPHIFNTKKIPVQNITVSDFKTQNMIHSFQVFEGLHFEFNERYLRDDKNTNITVSYNTLFDKIAHTFTDVVNNDIEYNTFINEQVTTMNNGVKIITLSKNIYYIFLTTLHIYDALHDYKRARSANMNIAILKDLLGIQKTKLNREHTIAQENHPNHISAVLVEQFNTFTPSNIEPQLKAFSTALLKENPHEVKPAVYYDQARHYFESVQSELANSQQDVHHIISNAPSRYKYNKELLDNEISPASTLNNNCFANMGTIMDGSTAGMCGSVNTMLAYNRVNLQIGESNIRMGCDDTNYIQYNSKIFTFGNKLYSSLIVKRVVGSRTYYAHYVYKVLDKDLHSSDEIHVGTQSTGSKYTGGETDFLFKYCPPFMGEFVTANNTNIIDNTYNKDPELSILFDYSQNRRDIIHYAWKSLCDFTQSWLTLLKDDTTYTTSYIEGNVHPLIVIHGDQPAHSLNEIILRFSIMDMDTRKNTNMHTVLALKKCLKISNIAGIVTYVDLRLMKNTNIQPSSSASSPSSSALSTNAKTNESVVSLPKTHTESKSIPTRKKRLRLLASNSLPTYNKKTTNIFIKSNSLPLLQNSKRKRSLNSASIRRLTKRNKENTPTSTPTRSVRRSLRIYENNENKRRKNGGSPPSTPPPSKKNPSTMTGIKDKSTKEYSLVKYYPEPEKENPPLLPVAEIINIDEIWVVIAKIFLDPDIANSILNFKYTGDEILCYNAFLYTMFTKKEKPHYLPSDFLTSDEPFEYDKTVYGLLNDDETNGIYNELVTIYKRIIDNII